MTRASMILDLEAGQRPCWTFLQYGIVSRWIASKAARGRYPTPILVLGEALRPGVANAADLGRLGGGPAVDRSHARRRALDAHSTASWASAGFLVRRDRFVRGHPPLEG